jgi:TonB family protein
MEMTIREYFKKCPDQSSWKISFGLSFFLHGLVILGGGWVLAQGVQYGMASSVLGGGNPAVQPPAEETVDLEDNEGAPAEQRKTLKPTPKPVTPAGIGGKVSGQVSQMPSYYLNPPPSYPMEARIRKEEGVVMLQARVDSQGKVSALTLVQSSGFSDLDQSALETVKVWQFKPARTAGIPVETSVNIPIRFYLKDFH